MLRPALPFQAKPIFSQFLTSLIRCTTLPLHAPSLATMPPKKSTTNGKAATNGKRKSPPSPSTSNNSKKPRPSASSGETHGSIPTTIVDRRFYPSEMTAVRATKYTKNEITRPIALLEEALAETHSPREKIDVKDAVVHWFKCDLRTKDNRALALASETAKSKDVPLVCIYLVSPQDFEAHLTSAVRVDFILRTLDILKSDLARLNIPLYIETVPKRKNIGDRILQLCDEWGASHLYANIEYEVDELRREATLVREGLGKGVAVYVEHDTCVVAPKELKSGTGNQYAVYSPWFRAWVTYLHAHPKHLELSSSPEKNPALTREKFVELFEAKIPEAPSNKVLTPEEKKKFKSLWPAGEHAAHERLAKFLKEKAGGYADARNIPSENGTAKLSVHFASGTLSARSAIAAAKEANTSQKLDGGNKGIMVWISEVAWRDFYKHVLAHWPHVCMHKAFKTEYHGIDWEYDEEALQAWKDGKTGYPIVDAAMREMKETGYMHNRCRMIAASFLAKDLLLDWRLGERHFMLSLVDGDFASNNGGWGFSASAGVDPQPYFRIFNPLLQSEKFDAGGAYIRKWVTELKGVEGKAIHDPWGRGKEAEAKNVGYPERIVDHKFARERALTRYKEGLGRNTA